MVARRKVLALGAALGVTSQAVADEPRRIGFVEAGTPAANGHFLEAFVRGLRQLGYVPDQNVMVAVRWAAGRTERFPPLIQEILVHRPDVLVVSSTPGALAAKAATRTVPVVFVGASNPIASGLVNSFARPGGNVTGLSTAGEDGTIGKIGEQLRLLVPNARKIGLLWNPTGANEACVRGAERALGQLGMTPIVVALPRIEDLGTAFDALRTEHIEALIVVTDPLTLARREDVARMAAQRRIPTGYEFAEFARAGGLLAYAPKVPLLFERAAWYVDKILRGQSPAELPVEQPTAYELVINLTAASALGLEVPAALKITADELIR